MHEYGIVRKAFDLVCQEGRKREKSGNPIKKIIVRIGKARGIPEETFRSMFSQMVDGTPYKGIEIEFHEIPLVVNCDHCGFRGEVADAIPHMHVIPTRWPCPRCGKDARIVSGTEAEMQIV